MKTVIIDYGMGNLHSVENALRYIGADCFISDDKNEHLSSIIDDFLLIEFLINDDSSSLLRF